MTSTLKSPPSCPKNGDHLSQAAIVNKVAKAREHCNGSLVNAKADKRLWNNLVREVDRVVRVMPLWKLQTIGRQEVPFLYDRNDDGHTLELKQGVAYNFRLFNDLIRQLIEGAWSRHIRSIGTNQRILGETYELREFLFGSERENMSAVRPLLREIQGGICFYCENPIRKLGDVDHFIPWSRYPVDLGHNFVLAHGSCNRQKRDFLAARPHLEKWINRNIEDGSKLSQRWSPKFGQWCKVEATTKEGPSI